MSETDTETTLCDKCSVPIDVPKPVHFGPFLAFQRAPLCKDCVMQRMIEDFNRQHHLDCPFKTPKWRPKG